MTPKVEYTEPDVSGSEKPLTRAQKKNMRKKQKKKEAKNEYAFEIEEVTTAMEGTQISEVETTTTTTEPEQSSEVQETDPSSTDVRRKVRTIRKKLKQIEELEKKLDMGEINPNKEQIAKLSKKEEYLQEIEALSATL